MDQRVALLSAQDSLKATLTGALHRAGHRVRQDRPRLAARRALPRAEDARRRSRHGQRGRADGRDHAARWTSCCRCASTSSPPRATEDRRRCSPLAMALALYLFLGFFSSVRSSVARLAGRLRSLSEHDTAALRTGLETIARRDLTFEIAPVTEPIADIDRDELGEVARAVNAVRDDTVASVHAYNATRAALAEAIGQVAPAPSRSRAPHATWPAPPSRPGARSRRSPTPSPTSPAAPSARSTARAPPARPPTTSPPRPSRASPTRSETVVAAQHAREAARSGGGRGQRGVRRHARGRGVLGRARRETIRGLSASPTTIGGIAATITGIAEQTNLLALERRHRGGPRGRQRQGLRGRRRGGPPARRGRRAGRRARSAR